MKTLSSLKYEKKSEFEFRIRLVSLVVQWLIVPLLSAQNIRERRQLVFAQLMLVLLITGIDSLITQLIRVFKADSPYVTNQ